MMVEPWFDPGMGWIFGTAFGVLGGVLGGVGGPLAGMGRARTAVLTAFRLAVLLSAVMAAAAVVAFISGQPYGVWYALGLPGVIGLVVFGGLTPMVVRRYQEAEQRKMAAMDAAGTIPRPPAG